MTVIIPIAYSVAFQLRSGVSNYHLTTFSRACAACGCQLSVGDLSVCFLFADEAGNWARLSVKKACLEAFRLPENVVGRWERTVPDGREDVVRESRRVLQDGEALFLSLYDGAEQVEGREVIKQVLALFLERKARLRFRRLNEAGGCVYGLVGSSAEYLVPKLPLRSESLLVLRDVLGILAS